MKAHRAVLVAALSLLFLTTAVVAHHAVGEEYDSEKPITLKGTVTKVEWANPHARLYVEGTTTRSTDLINWEVLLASPNLLALNGLKINSLRPGDHVTVSAYPARNGSHLAYANKVKRDTH